jgi:antitoxin component of MazEF toxin-antitoxin module
MKDVYIVQPYKVGSSKGKSLAIIVPAELVKEYKIGISTILALSPDNKREKITIQTITRIADRFEKMIPTGESFEASTQQVSSSGVQ